MDAKSAALAVAECDRATFEPPYASTNVQDLRLSLVVPRLSDLSPIMRA